MIDKVVFLIIIVILNVVSVFIIRGIWMLNMMERIVDLYFLFEICLFWDEIE